MKVEFYPLEQLKKDIIKIVGKHLNLNSYQIFFFGSRVTGRGNERSDIDIGLDGPSEIPARVVSKIKEEMENLPTLYKIEIVDFKNISSDFRQVALQQVERIN